MTVTFPCDVKIHRDCDFCRGTDFFCTACVNKITEVHWDYHKNNLAIDSAAVNDRKDCLE